MPIVDYIAWETELIKTGRIVQDDDSSVSAEEAEDRFNRYMKLVDSVEGTEGVAAAKALLRSIQVKHDYGAYQNTINKLLFLFPPTQYIEAILTELPRLIENHKDWAGDLLSSMTLTPDDMALELSVEFNAALKRSPPTVQNTVLKFIREQETEGWLEDEKGILGI